MTLSLIKQLPETKAELVLFSSKVKESILNGDINPIEIDVRLKFLEELINSIRKDKDVKDLIVSEIHKYEKTFNYRDKAIITISERSSYDYTNDCVYTELKEKIKARENLLKALPKNGMADTETGEMVYPPIVKKTDIVSYKLL
jgi:hypothetical protein